MDVAPNFQLKSESPRPIFAAALSVVPGLGQIYLGDTRKGILFLFATLFSALPLAYCALRRAFNEIVWSLTNTYHLRFDSPPSFSIQEITPVSPQAVIAFGLFLGFILFAMIDAYKRANFIRRDEYVRSLDLKTCEATPSISTYEATTKSILGESGIVSVPTGVKPAGAAQEVEEERHMVCGVPYNRLAQSGEVITLKPQTVSSLDPADSRLSTTNPPTSSHAVEIPRPAAVLHQSNPLLNQTSSLLN